MPALRGGAILVGPCRHSIHRQRHEQQAHQCRGRRADDAVKIEPCLHGAPAKTLTTATSPMSASTPAAAGALAREVPAREQTWKFPSVAGIISTATTFRRPREADIPWRTDPGRRVVAMHR